MISPFLLNANTLKDSLIDVNKKNLKLGKYVSYYIQEKTPEVFTDIQNKKFINNHNDILNLGFGAETIWLKLHVKNDATKSVLKLLKIQKPLQDYLALYTNNKDGLEIDRSGFMVNEGLKTYSGASTYFSIELKPLETKTYYLKVKSKYGRSFDMELVSETKYRNSEKIELIIICLLIGVLSSISLYNLFLGYSLKDYTYVLYALAIASSLFAQVTIRGFTKQFFINNNPMLLEWSPPFFLALSTVMLSLFCIKFLELKKYSKMFYFLMLAVVVYQIIAFIYQVILFEVFNIYITNTLVALGTMLFGFIALTAGIVVYNKGNKYAIYFIYAWSLYCLTIVIYVLTLIAVLPINGFTNNAYMLGSVVEALLLAFALADRYTRLKAEKVNLITELVSKDKDLNTKTNEIVALMSESVIHLNTKAKIIKDLDALKKQKNNVGVTSILAELKSNHLEDSKSKLIKENINTINFEYLNRLKEKHQNLTPTDIEICSFIKLGLSRKEISKIRCTTEASVKTARNRVRKKINIPSEVTLDEYLKEL